MKQTDEANLLNGLYVEYLPNSTTYGAVVLVKQAVARPTLTVVRKGRLGRKFVAVYDLMALLRCGFSAVTG